MPRGVHNGAGRGGRRPSVSPSSKPLEITLSPAQRYLAKHIGDGNAAAGIRALLRQCSEASTGCFIDVTHPSLGACILTDEHSASSYGQPVLVPASDPTQVYGPADVPPGAMTEPIPGAWSQKERSHLRRWASLPVPVRWDIDLQIDPAEAAAS